jgi:predicted nucleic acid-binding protein
MLVVSDTTPLLYLARVGQLHLLCELYVEVVVPQTVWDELVEARPDAPGVGVVRAATWLRVVPDVAAPTGAVELLADIDAGEAAAIALALDRDADLLLIDDAAGRRAAGELGVSVRGTLGVLVTAKAAGALAAVAPVISALLGEGFRASEAVVEQALRASGESPTPLGRT